MENENVQLVDDNCSQIEVAFKRMKVGTSRCGKKAHQNIYNQLNHYQPALQLTSSHRILPDPQSSPPQPLQPQLPLQQQQQQQLLPNQIAQHPDHQLNANQMTPNTITVNPYYNQMFNTNSSVIPTSSTDKPLDELSPMDEPKGEPVSFSSFGTSPLVQRDHTSYSNTILSSSSSSSSSISPPLVNPVNVNSMGPYREAFHREGQIDTFHPHQNQNQNQNQPTNQASENAKYEDGPQADPDVSVEELAAYLDVQLYIPRKMSYMAELMYT